MTSNGQQPRLWVRSGRAVLWFVLAFGLFAAALLATWYAWSAANFGYRYWHDAIGIDATIEQYAPQNIYRQGFAKTTVDERVRLFGAIVSAINGDAGRLKTLRYHAPDGRVLGYLLRPAEIEHLKDVAWLVDWFEDLTIIVTLLAIAIAIVAIARGWPLPRPRAFAGGTALVGGIIGLLLVVFGPTTVFYTLHTWIFPPDHQWFFYYEQSLMSTMMRAPVLFGAIAAEWIATALPLFMVLVAGQRWLHRRFQSPRHDE